LSAPAELADGIEIKIKTVAVFLLDLKSDWEVSSAEDGGQLTVSLQRPEFKRFLLDEKNVVVTPESLKASVVQSMASFFEGGALGSNPEQTSILKSFVAKWFEKNGIGGAESLRVRFQGEE
jgi:hypothetical protein